jgi:hypothetical protein
VIKLINDDAFARMVAEDVKNKLSPFHKNQLMDKGNWDRWKNALILLSENIQEQIDDISADMQSDEDRYNAMGQSGKKLAREARAAYESRLKKVSRFKFHVDKKLDEVTAMIDTGLAVASDGWDKVDFLKRAIAKHRSMIYEYDFEHTAIDSALWAALDEKWEFDDIKEELLWNDEEK